MSLIPPSLSNHNEVSISSNTVNEEVSRNSNVKIAPNQDVSERVRVVANAVDHDDYPTISESTRKLNRFTLRPESSSIPSSRSWLDEEARLDFEHIEAHREKVIAGFLNIGKKQDWKDGGHSETGFRFTRYMLRSFWEKNAKRFSEHSDIFNAVLGAFSPSVNKGNKGTNASRAYFDVKMTGSKDHAITRFVGNLSSEYRENGPFFEVLINSQKVQIIGGDDLSSALNELSSTIENFSFLLNRRNPLANHFKRATSETDKSTLRDNECNPFFSTVYDDRKAADERYRSLQELSLSEISDSYNKFYSISLIRPEKYPQVTNKKLGPNSTRILQALAFLDKVVMRSQTVGNCWIKQPQRAVLLSLYIETVTRRKELTFHEALNFSITLYKRWIKETENEVETLVNRTGYDLRLHILAIKELESRRNK